MANQFQPLEARLAHPRESAAYPFRLMVVPHAAAEAPAPAPAPPGAPAQADPHELTLTLERDGERITAIHIRCACGRIIELGCVY